MKEGSSRVREAVLPVAVSTVTRAPEPAPRPSTYLLYGLLTLMILFWSFNFVVARIVLRELPSLLTASIRPLLAGLLLLPLYLWKGRQTDKEPWSKKDVPLLLLLGITGVTLNQSLFLLGFERTSTGHAAILTGLLPLQVLVLSALAGAEILHPRRIFGMLVAFSGVVLLQVTRDPAASVQPTLLGDTLIFLAGTMFAIFAVAGKRLTVKHGGLTVNTFAFLGGGVFLIPVIVWELWRFDISAVSATAWLCIVYMAVFPSAVAYLIFYYALTYIPASRVSTFGYLQPPLATAFAALLLGDPVSGGLIGGGALVLAGVYLTERT